MAKVRHEALATSSATQIASLVIDYLQDSNNFSFEDAIDVHNKNIVNRMFKPDKKTLLHYFIEWFCDPYEDIDNLHKNCSIEEAEFPLIRMLLEFEQIPDIKEFKFHKTVQDRQINGDYDSFISELKSFVTLNHDLIKDHLVHSTFQILFLDRHFLHDFNKKVSEVIKENKEYLASAYPKNLTNKQTIRRNSNWPKWLVDAIFYRDKGHCVICRTNLTNQYSVDGTANIDHIIPLKLYGSNDSSNYQLLCNSCNASKGARTTETNNMNVPFWNYDYKEIKEPEEGSDEVTE
ncbi:HNH endonuclease [Bacillus inaquosorum]|uniref:HNH endonuclease n=1 Tax=Bacillus inaquosorum TaxID=483913 RepID=UPI003F15EE44